MLSLLVPGEAFPGHEFVSVLSLGRREVDRDGVKRRVFVPLHDLAKLRPYSGHCLMRVFFVVMRQALPFVDVLVLHYSGSLVMGNTLQKFALVALSDHLVDLFSHFLVFFEEVWVKIGTLALLIVALLSRFAIGTEHLSVFFLEEGDRRV